MIALRPATLEEANALVRQWHRHHKMVRTHRFSIMAEVGDRPAGVAVVGNPKAPELNRNPRCFEVNRVATPGGVPNVASRLLGAAWRAAKAMGVTRMVSYVRVDELATSYRAAGWHRVADVAGRGWDTGNKSTRWLPGLYEPATGIVDRVRWEIGPECACDACAKVRLVRARAA